MGKHLTFLVIQYPKEFCFLVLLQAYQFMLFCHSKMSFELYYPKEQKGTGVGFKW
jgi:hypothetical protein